MGEDAKSELEGKNWEERYDWILKQKEEGNKLYKAQSHQEALDVYLKSLCGFDFGSDQTREQQERVEKELKAPILNNMALCLMKQKKHQQANKILDQVLKSDPSNFKALIRKSDNYIQMGDLENSR